MVYLCLSGSVMVLGMALVLARPDQFFGKSIINRRWLMGCALFIQAPLGLLLGQLLLGDTAPGPIDGAPLLEARDRIAATLAEWGTLCSAWLLTLILLWRAPDTEERQAIHANSPYKETEK